MRILLILAVALSAPCLAEAVVLKPDDRPEAARIQGRTAFSASHRAVAARGEGERNLARNSAGVIREGARIRGNTTLTASQESATAVAAGRGNTAANEAGVIGGN